MKTKLKRRVALGTVLAVLLALAMVFGLVAPVAAIVSVLVIDSPTETVPVYVSQGGSVDVTYTFTTDAGSEDFEVEIFDAILGNAGPKVTDTWTGTAGDITHTTTFPLDPLVAEGSYDVKVTPLSAPALAVTETDAVIVDNTPPAAPTDLDAPPYIGIGNVAAYPVSGVAELGSTVEVRLTDGTNTVTGTGTADPTTGAFSINVDCTTLLDGTITIDAMATDAAGNPGPYCGPITRAKDTVAPAAPTDLDAPPYIGIGNVAAYPVSGVAELGSTVEVRLTDGTNTVTGTGTADPTTGAFSINVDCSTLVDGDIDIDAMATDEAGNPGPYCGPITRAKDTVAPAAPTDVDAPLYIGIGNVAAYPVSGVAELGSTVTVRLTDGTSTVTGTGLADAITGEFLIEVDCSTLVDGTITIDAMATDEAGNPGPYCDLITRVKVIIVGGGGGGGGGGYTPADTTAPITSDVSASEITATSATITWTTNEPSTSQVEYWPGSLSPLDTTMVTSHSVTLTDLTPDTTYHYQTRSVDAAGNLAESDEYTFTTEAAPVTLESVSLAPSTASILVGETGQFSATATYSDGSTADISADATWASSDEAVATVEAGLASGVGEGTATITVTFDGMSQSATIDVAAAPAGLAWWVWLIIGIACLAAIIGVGLVITRARG